MPTLTVAELARLVGGTVVGNPDLLLSACNTLMEATASQVSLLHNAKYAKELETTKAGCVILPPNTLSGLHRAPDAPPLSAIESKNPYYAWQQAMVNFMGFKPHPAIGISPRASIHPTAKIGNNVTIHPFVAIAENAVVGDNTVLYPQVTLMAGAKVGNNSILYPGVSLYDACIIGDRCIIHAGTVIGSDGTAFAQANGIHHKMPQVGIAIIEDDVEIATNSVVERGALNPTRVGRGTKIGSCSVIGHNCQIGPGNMIITHVAIAGSATTGKYVVIAGQVGVNGHTDIPDFVKVGAQSGVLSNPEPNTEILGTPAMEASHARRVYLQFTQLPELAKRVKELEKQIAKLTPPTS
jgi:UDP-3-O-[3-hydroxymyristoyl] glucosamine N-acyltransferase